MTEPTPNIPKAYPKIVGQARKSKAKKSGRNIKK